MKAAPYHNSRIALRRAGAIQIAYLAHLALPAFLLVDTLVLPSLAGLPLLLGSSDKMVAALGSVWLAGGLAALLLSRDRERFLGLVQKALLSFYTVLVIVGILEPVARRVFKRRSPYPGVWMAKTRILTRADPLQTPGVSGIKKFTVNEIGLRGPPVPQDGNPYRIVTIGGSTTECAALDDSEEWPHLLMEGLNARQASRRVWVGNAGISGHTAVQHRALLESLPILDEADLVIFFIGANDLWTTIAARGAPTAREQEHYAALFSASLRGTQASRFPLYKRFRVFELVRDTVIAVERKFTVAGSESEVNYNTSRRKRAASPRVQLPKLEAGLQEYRERVLALARLCKVHGTHCLFLTQTSLWRPDLSAADQQLLWFGWVGPWTKPIGYIGVADAARALEAYNHTLLDVCQSNRLECFDLASRVPRDTSNFYDDFHLTEKGAGEVARALTDYVLGRAPFAERSDLLTSRRPFK